MANKELWRGFFNALVASKIHLPDQYASASRRSFMTVKIDKSSRRGNESILQGSLNDALNSAEIMQQQGVPISRHHALCLLQECTKHQDVEGGRRVQTLISQIGLDSVSLLADHLIRLFATCGCLSEAETAFKRVPKPSGYTWNAIIRAHAKLGQGEAALQLYDKMLQSGITGDNYTYVAVLQACINTSNLKQGRSVHKQILKSDLQWGVEMGTTLVDMYAKCGSLEEAYKVFESLPNRNVVSWNAIIRGHAKNGQGKAALQLYDRMLLSGVKCDMHTFAAVLEACIITGNLDRGKQIHDEIIKHGLQLDIVTGNTLVDMYAKCGSLQDARKVFDSLSSKDAFSWTAMILGYAKHGYMKEARKFFNEAPNQDAILWTAMITGYAKCGNMEEARNLFDKLSNRDVVTWGAMISGYGELGESLLAIDCFDKMQMENIKPDRVIFLSILKACASIGAIEHGKNIHQQIIEHGLDLDPAVNNALVYMYAMFGSLEVAHDIWDRLPTRDVISWNGVIAGHAQRGKMDLAYQCIEDMQREGIKPNEVTFNSILAACTHAGLVNEGCRYFKSMKEDHGIKPDNYHHTCMVDLFGRAGLLDEAKNLLHTIDANVVGWISLLVSCRTYGNVELGRQCFNEVVKLDSRLATGYVLMAGIYSDARMCKEAAEIEELRKLAKAWKKPARVWIEVNNKVHEFVVGDKAHPQSEEIYAMLKSLSTKMKKNGYMPKLDYLLQKISEEEKEDALCGHSEKLAVAFGLLTTPPGTTLRATKNLRMCMDCHSATKIIAKIENRDIIIRDAYHMHHFKDGFCSCGDHY